MNETTLKKSYTGHWVVTLLVLAVAGAAAVMLGVHYWDFIKGSAVLYSLVKIVLILVPLMLGVAYLTFAERKIIGYMQVRIGPNRVGPRGWLQPIADALKLLIKEIIVPTNANRFLFIVAPMLSIAPALAAWAVMPFTDDAGAGQHRCRPAVYPGADLGRRLRRHHRRLGVELEIRLPRRHALGGADRRPTKSPWASRWSAC